jgi:hypothetical protein
LAKLKTTVIKKVKKYSMILDEDAFRDIRVIQSIAPTLTRLYIGVDRPNGYTPIGLRPDEKALQMAAFYADI